MIISSVPILRSSLFLLCLQSSVLYNGGALLCNRQNFWWPYIHQCLPVHSTDFTYHMVIYDIPYSYQQDLQGTRK